MTRPVIIGLAGGIGAGKSRVAQELGRLGAVVLDSDRQAKEALDLTEVQKALRVWWGPAVFEAGGRVDRKALATLIFSDPAKRKRLESLTHPIVKQARIAAIAAAASAGTPAVVIDAPLLFEAGVDAECDAVIFVDAPPTLRLDRVKKDRAWGPAELTRRESQQLPLDEKRRRSGYLLANTGDEARLAAEAARLYGEILARFRGTRPPAPA